MIGCCAAPSCLAASPQWVKSCLAGPQTGAAASLQYSGPAALVRPWAKRFLVRCLQRQHRGVSRRRRSGELRISADSEILAPRLHAVKRSLIVVWSRVGREPKMLPKSARCERCTALIHSHHSHPTYVLWSPPHQWPIPRNNLSAGAFPPERSLWRKEKGP
jgi:hypothetical protein